MPNSAQDTFNTLSHLRAGSARRWLGYAAFWSAVFVLNAGPHWEIYKTSRELIETAGLITALQFITAALAINFLVPRYLEQNRRWAFALALVIVVFAVAQLNILARFLYLEPLYPESYSTFLKNFGHMSLWERLDPTWTSRYILFSKMPLFLMPTALLIAYHFHQKQQLALQWQEQKKSAELDALRNQLNPHFIFNTLNNIYALAVKKSDETPLAIEKLSNILDYVVYRCNEKFVPLSDEIELAHNYLGLEELRYGDRLQVKFKKDVSEPSMIAPLILLTLLENACKHSASNELGQAKLDINIKTQAKSILIEICNSKPTMNRADNNNKKQIGLENLRKQLALLYPNEHELIIKDTARQYSVTLQLTS